MIIFKSLTNKIVVTISIAIIAFVAIAIPTLVNNEREDIINHACDEIELMAQAEAKEIEKHFDLLIDKSETQALLLKAVNSKERNRERADELMYQITQKGSNTISAWAVFFENTFDQKDEQYKNTARYGKSGAYSVWYHKYYSSNPKLDVLPNFEEEEWFINLNYKAELKILEPYKYLLDNDSTINIISISVPITENNKNIGFTGCDALNSDINNMISDISFFEDDYACFISDKGNYAAHPVKELLGTHISTDVSDEKSLQSFQNGEAFHSAHHSPYLNKEVFDFYIPLRFRNYDKTWYLRISAPQYIITEKVDAYRVKIFILFAIASFFCITVVFLINYYSIKPLTKISQNTLNLATKGTSGAKSIYVKSNNEIGALSKSYNKLIKSLTEKEELDKTLIKNEKELRKIHSLSDLALDLSNSAAWYMDMVNYPDRLFASEKLLQDILGELPQEGENYILVQDLINNAIATNKELGKEVTAHFTALMNGTSDKTDSTYQYTRKVDGEIIWFRSVAVVNKDTQGNIIGLQGVGQDITLQKQQEQKIHESEQRLKIATESSGMAVWEWDTKLDKSIATDNYIDLFGFDPQKENVYEKWKQNLHPDDFDKVMTALSDCLEEKTAEYNSEFRYRKAENEDYFWMKAHGIIVDKYVDGSPKTLIGVNHSINDLKQKEQQLRENKTRLQQVLKTGKMGAYELDYNTNKAKIDALLYEIVGIPANCEDLFGEFITHLHPDDTDVVLDSIQKSKTDSARNSINIEYRYIHPQKGVIWLLTSAKILDRNSDGSGGREIGFIQDVTGRKLQEEEREKLLTQQKVANEQAKMGSWYIDCTQEPLYIYMDENLVEIEGVTGSDVTKFEEWAKNLSATNTEGAKIVEKAYDTLANPTIFSWDETYQSKRPIDGKVVWLRSKAIINRNSQGNPTVLYGSTQDVTAQKQVEEALVMQTELNEKLARISTKYINVAIKDIDSAISEALQEIGKHINADRVYVFAYDAENKFCSNTYEWCAEGITPEIDNCQNTPLAELAPDWIEAHKNNLHIHIPDVSVYENKEVREMLEMQEIKSLLHMPLLGNNKLYGFLGFDSVKQKYSYSEQDVDFMRVFAQILANLESRREVEENLNLAKEQAESALDIANSGAWHIDFVNDAERVFLDDSLIKIQGELLESGVNHYSTSKWLKNIQESNDKNGKELVESISEHMSNPKKNKLEMEFEYIRPIDHKPIWLKVKANISRNTIGKPTYAEGVSQDITKQKNNEYEILLAQKRLETQLRVNEHEITNIQDFLDYAQNEAIMLTESKFGFIYFYNEQTKEFTLNTWSEGVMKECKIVEKQTKYQLEKTGLWGEVVRQRIPIIVNNYRQEHPHVKGTPKGHVKLERYMSIPIFSNNKIVAVVGVANKEADYTNMDKQQLVLMMDSVWKKVEQHKAQMEIKRSRENIQSVLETVPVAVAVVDIENSKIIMSNEAAIKMFAIDKQKINEYCTTDIWIDKDARDKAVDQLLKTKAYYGEDKLKRLGNDEEIWAQQSAIIFEYEDKPAMLISLVDTTEHKKLQLDLEKAQQAADSIVDTIAIPMAVTDRKTGEILRANTAMAKFHGVEMNDFANMKAGDWYVNPDERKMIVGKLESQGFVKDEPVQMLRYKTKEERSALLSFIELNYYNNKALIGSITDITKIKETQAQLEKAKNEAEAASLAKSSFLANMSHEIRTPMNAIIGFTEILDSKIKDKEQKLHLQSIFTSSKALLSLINDVLDLTKIEVGKMSLNYETVSTNQFISEIEIMFKERAGKKGLNLECNKADNLPETILMDELRLRQVAINLVGNAVKFTKQGFVNLNLNAKDITDDDFTLIMEVTDTGIGIHKERLSEVFEDFTQEDGSITRNYGGTGLGLSISKKIINLLKGDLKVQSEVNKGSTFTLEIPKVEYLKKENIVEELNQHSPDEIKFENADILAVDDIDSNRMVLQNHFEKLGFKVYLAKNGVQAVEMASEILPDIIFMDLRMPEMDGYTATAKLKEKPETAHIPVIACTASAFTVSKNDILKSGFSGYIRKPFLLSDIVNELCKLLKWEKLDVKKETKIEEKTLTVKEIEQLKQTLEHIWGQLLNRRTTKLSKQFADILISEGKQMNNVWLSNKGKDLQQAIVSFNVEQTQNIIDEFKMIFKN